MTTGVVIMPMAIMPMAIMSIAVIMPMPFMPACPVRLGEGHGQLRIGDALLNLDALMQLAQMRHPSAYDDDFQTLIMIQMHVHI